MRWSGLWFRRPRGRHAAGRGRGRSLPLVAIPPGRLVQPQPVPVPVPASSVSVPPAPDLVPARVPAPRPPAPTAVHTDRPLVELGFADGRRQTVTPSAQDALAINDVVRRLVTKAR